MTICINGLFKNGTGTKSQVAAYSLPSWGPKSGRNCYITPPFSGVPSKRDKFTSGRITPASLGEQKWAELLPNPCGFGGPQRRGLNQNWLHDPRLLRGPKKGGIAK